MATIHFMHGFIGVGKTTIAKKLAAGEIAGFPNRMVRLNNDAWMVRLYGRGPHDIQAHFDYWRNILSIQWDLMADIIRAGTDVVLDYGTWEKHCRREWHDRALKITPNIIFHNVVCDIEVARARFAARSKSDLAELNTSDEAFNRQLKKYEPMTDDEGFTVIRHENNADNEHYILCGEEENAHS